MKHTKSIVSMAVASMALFSGCLFQEDDAFDESAALRSQHMVNDVNARLYSPEHGWVMQYFATRENSFDYYDELASPSGGDYVTVYTKGYNIYCQFFKNGTCILGSDHEWIRNYTNNTNNVGHVFVTDTTLFELNEQDGPVLSFNTWNEVLSPFVDPSNPNHWDFNRYGDNALNGEGLHGDNEFIIKSISDDEIVMKGQRHEGLVRLLRCPMPIEEYRQSVAKAESLVLRSKATDFMLISDNGTYADTVYTYGMNTSVMGFAYAESADEVVNYQPFISTINGIRFQRPVDLQFYKVTAPGDTTWWSYTTQEFRLNDTNTGLVSDDGKMVFTPNWMKTVNGQMLQSRSVSISLTEGCEKWQELCAALNESMAQVNKTYSVVSISLGKSSESGSKGRNGLAFEFKKGSFLGFGGNRTVDDHQIVFDFNPEDGSNNLSAFTKAGKDVAFKDIVSFLTDSWNVVAESSCANYVLTSASDPSKQIVLNAK